MKAALAALALAACGRFNFDSTTDAQHADAEPDANPVTNPPPALWTDGTRLRAIRTGAGTTELFAGWHDTMFDFDCSVRVAEDGVERCLPSTWVVQPTDFGDAACTQVLATTDTGHASCGFPAQFAIELNTATPGRIDAIVGVHGGAHYYLNGGACTQDMFPDATTTFYDITGSIAPTSFVAAHQERTRNHDLSYIEYVYDDGARELTSQVYDHRIDDTCYVAQVSTDRALCVPDTKATPAMLFFKDAACTQGVVQPASTTASVVVMPQDDVCGDRQRVLSLGAQYVGGLYQLMASGCTLVATNAVAYEVAPANVPQFSRALLPPSGGVQAAHWQTNDGFDLPNDRYLWNPATADWCEAVVVDATNQVSCAPWWSPLDITVYSDATCTTSQTPYTTDCIETTAATDFPTADGLYTCDGFRETVRTETRPYSVANAYILSEHGCQPVDLGAHPLRTWENSIDGTGLPTLDRRR